MPKLLFKNYFHAIATLVGVIIGVGMFAIPFVISRSGILLFFIYLPILGIVQYFFHTFYAEIILSTKNRHRLPGYVGEYFCNWKKIGVLIVAIIGNSGSLLAYIIIGGIFLHQLLGLSLGGDVFIYATILFIIEAIIVLYGLKLIASVELIMTGLLIFMVALISWRGWGMINFSNYEIINWQNAFLPYGPIFFAVGGSTAIPMVCELLAHKKENIKSAIAWGTIIPIIIILIFTFVVVGITGVNTSPDTLTGLSLVLSSGVIDFALIFGLFTIITSFLVVAQAMREIYWLDLKINKNISWALACLVPYLFYILGARNLTKVVSLSGAIVGGIVGMVFIWLVLKVKKNRKLIPVINNKLNKPLAFILSFLFILGLIYAVLDFIK